MKGVLLVSSLASLVVLVSAAYLENFRGEWRQSQRAYKGLLVAAAGDEAALRAAQSFPVEHRQLYLPQLGAIDRCTTCHLGMENPAMADAATTTGEAK